MKRILAIFVLLALLFAGCDTQLSPEASADTPGDDPAKVPTWGSANAGSSPLSVMDTSELFTDRDKDFSYDTAKIARIQLNGDSAECDSSAVQISGSTVTIADEGTYLLCGALNDGMIIVNADKTDKIQLVLDGASINSQTSAAIYILQADKVFLTLAENSENTVSNGGTFTAIDENNIDAAIFSKEDLTLNGSGRLTVTSPTAHGIVSKDELTVTGGSYAITSASHGITGKDSICITNAVFDIASGKDGIHAENADDTTLGFVFIESGTFDITAEGDGVSASASMQIDGGSFNILSGGGSVNGDKQTSDSWGSMGGGGRPGGGGFMGGGFGGPGGSMGSNSPSAEEDSTSIKGIKASGNLLINGGSFTIDSADDAVHSNASLTANGGSFTIATGDDGFHADEALTILSGTVSITESYEGLEGLSIDISGGDISLISSDDGLNAAGGNDQSGFGGNRPDSFGSSSNSYIHISGGKLLIQASGDGIDSNGTLTISGGSVTVSGPTQGDTAVLDYDTTGIITGGTFIGTGSYMMAQSFTDSENQGVIAVSVGTQAAGTEITLTDAKGNTVICHTPELSFAIVILSSPDIIKGETYTITVGTASGSFEAK